MKKQTLIYVIVAAALLLAVLILENPFKSKPQEGISDNMKIEKVKVFENVTDENISKIFVESKDDRTSFTLHHVEKTWALNEKGTAKVDPAKMEQIWNSIKNSGDAEIISQNPETQKKFNLSDTASHVIFYDKGGKILEDIYIGKPGTDYQSTYVRRAKSDAIMRINGQLSYTFGYVRGADDWRNKRILNADWQKVIAYKIKGPQGETHVEKLSSGEWEILKPERKAASKTIAETVVRSAAYLSASGFEDNEKGKTISEFGLEPAEWTITLIMQDHDTTPTVRFSAAKESEIFAMLEGDSQIYKVREPQIKSICKKPEELLPTPTPTPGAPAEPGMEGGMPPGAMPGGMQMGGMPAGGKAPKGSGKIDPETMKKIQDQINAQSAGGGKNIKLDAETIKKLQEQSPAFNKKEGADKNPASPVKIDAKKPADVKKSEEKKGPAKSETEAKKDKPKTEK